MEAPEKIYVKESMLFATNPEITLPNNNKIEYTRTDAFIEKACEWMSSHLQTQYSGFSDFIKDFRKAMKKSN